MSLLPPRGHRTLPLTKRQAAILVYIAAVVRVQGRAPSERMIAFRFGLNRTTVREHLLACYRRGWLRTPSPDGLWCTHEPHDGEVPPVQSST